MAKRVPKDEQRFNPLDESLVRAVVNRTGAKAAEATDPPPEPQTPSDPVPEREPSAAVVGGSRSSEEGRIDKRLPARSPAPEASRRDREKRVLLTREEERDVERFVTRFAAELGTPVKFSHLLRASITLMLHGEEELIERAKRAGLDRPANGNAPELARFEHGVAEILSLAYRDARPLR